MQTKNGSENTRSNLPLFSLTRGALCGALGALLITTGGAVQAQGAKPLVPLPFAGTVATTGPLGDLYASFMRVMSMALVDNSAKLAAAGWAIPKDGVFPNEDTQQRVDRAIPSLQLQTARGARIVTSILTPIVTAQAQVAGRSNALVFGPYLQGPELANLSNLLVGMMLADVEAKPLGTFAATQLKAKTAAVILVDDTYGTGTAAAFREAFTRGGGKVVSELRIPANPVDFRNESTRIASANPDLVFIIHRGAYNLVIETLRDAGFKGQLLSGSAALVAGKLTTAASTGGGMIISSLTGTEAARNEFRSRYKARWKEDLPADSALIPYAATEILVAALAKVPASADLDVKKVEAAWMGLGTVKTLLGEARITGRSVIYPINLDRVGEGGKLTWMGSCTLEKCEAAR